MQRLPGLDLLRAVAILWVMYFHAQVLGILTPDAVSTFGWMGVDLFFVLSGFLIGSQLLRPYAQGEAFSLGNFYLRRVLRTVPAYAVVLAMYYVTPAVHERPGLAPLWQFVSFTENWFVDFPHAKAFSHVWSLCVEEQFYVVAPLAAVLMAWRPAAWKIWLLLGVFLVGGILLRGFLWLHYLAPLDDTTPAKELTTSWLEHLYYPTWTRLDGLVVGVTLAMARVLRPRLWLACMGRANWLLGVGMAGVGCAMWLFQDQQGFWANCVGFPFLAVSIGCLVMAGASPAGVLGGSRVPGAKLVATLAYSLYLTHKQVYHVVSVGLGPLLVGRPVLALLCYSGAVLMVGAVLYLTVERPFLRLRSRWLGREGFLAG